MVQKKNETVPGGEPVREESHTAGSFAATLWDQIELSGNRSLELRESQEDAYLRAVKEVIQFNKQYRASLAKLYEQTKNTNKELAAGLMHSFNPGKEEAVAEGKAEAGQEREELKKQFKEVSGQLEDLALTPIKSIVHMIEGMEENFVNGVESRINFRRERRKAWSQVRKEYTNLARNAHLDLVERGKSSFRELVKNR